MTAYSILERQTAESLFRADFSQNGSMILVACSGGPDSTALLRCLHRLRTWHGLSLHVAHLNHDFRGAEADHDAAFVQLLADGLGLPCSIDKQDPIAYQRLRGVSSFEQAAREMRYQFLSKVAANVGASVVALGHTSDDQAETVLMHVLRGSGLHGLRGMSELTAWPWPQPNPGPLLFRPLLRVEKADTAAYCRELGQTFREDSGNYMWRFTRNKIRLDLMPRLARDYNPRVGDALLRLSRAAGDGVDYIDSEVDRLWPSLIKECGESVELDPKAVNRLHTALQRQVLRRAYAISAGDSRALRETHVDALLALVRHPRGGRSLHLPRGVRARVEGDRLHMARDSGAKTLPELEGEHTISLPSIPGDLKHAELGGWRVTLRLAELGESTRRSSPFEQVFEATLRRHSLGDVVKVRNRRPGDRFQPSGMMGTKKLQDYLVDAKVPRDQRDAIPLLIGDKGIAWIVGHRVAEWAVAQDGSPTVTVSFRRDV